MLGFQPGAREQGVTQPRHPKDGKGVQGLGGAGITPNCEGARVRCASRETLSMEKSNIPPGAVFLCTLMVCALAAAKLSQPCTPYPKPCTLNPTGLVMLSLPSGGGVSLGGSEAEEAGE